MITPSPNSHQTIELALLLQEGLGSELAKLGQKTWLLRLQEEATSIFKYPTPLLPPPGRGEVPSRLQWALWGLLGHQIDVCCVFGLPLTGWCELRSHHARNGHKGRFCLAEPAPCSVAFVTVETLKQMLPSGPGTVPQRDESAFCGLSLLEVVGGCVAPCGASTGLLALSLAALRLPASPVISVVQPQRRCLCCTPSALPHFSFPPRGNNHT